MKRALLLLILAVALPAMATTVYRWVDHNGVVHYSDQPHAGAVQVDLGTAPVLDFKVPEPIALPDANKPLREETPRHYEVTILAPADGTTLRPANHEVHAEVGVSPALGPNALLRYSLDGKPLGEPTVALRALIKQVYRGTHTLTVSVLTHAGGSAGSASSTFYVHQNSILLNPNRPPGPKPGPGGG